VANFGGMEAREGSRPGFDGGDRNDYYAVNRNNWLEPVQEFRSFSNPFKASSTVYRFAPVPAGVEVNPYPGNGDFFRSDRLVGGPNVSQLEWDRMNAVLGPTKQVNLILVRFSGKPAEYGKYQEAAWLGGKKNDLVICYGTDSSFTDTATWSYVFGWTEREDVKRNLETLALTNRVHDSFVPLVFAEVKANYVRKNWHDFDYITIQPPLGTMLLWIFLLVAFNGGLLYWMVTNKWTDDTDMDGYGRASYRPWR
jgi:hypothetical protein